MVAKSIQGLAVSYCESLINIILDTPISELTDEVFTRMESNKKLISTAPTHHPKRQKVVRKKLANKTTKVKSPPLALIHVELEK